MSISRHEQHAPRILALDGRILHERDGIILADFDLAIFRRLRRKQRPESWSGSPQRISKRGRIQVRAQLDNQGI